MAMALIYVITSLLAFLVAGQSGVDLSSLSGHFARTLDQMLTVDGSSISFSFLQICCGGGDGDGGGGCGGTWLVYIVP